MHLGQLLGTINGSGTIYNRFWGQQLYCEESIALLIGYHFHCPLKPHYSHTKDPIST